LLGIAIGSLGPERAGDSVPSALAQEPANPTPDLATLQEEIGFGQALPSATDSRSSGIGDDEFRP
jgi:hypothetical protein